MWSSQLCFLLGVSPLSSISIQWENIWLASLALGEDTNWMFSLRISSDCSNSSSSTQHLCCPSSRCSSRCCQRSRSNGRAIRRRGRRGWPSWPKSSLETNLLPGWKKMVSYTIRVEKVKDWLRWLKGTSAMQRFMLWMSWIVLVLKHNSQCWGRKTSWKQMATHAGRGILILHQSYFCYCDFSFSREKHFS